MGQSNHTSLGTSHGKVSRIELCTCKAFPLSRVFRLSMLTHSKSLLVPSWTSRLLAVMIRHRGLAISIARGETPWRKPDGIDFHDINSTDIGKGEIQAISFKISRFFEVSSNI
jgi:hypothetical protein